MTRDEFEYALLLHGADMTRWPADLAAAAKILIETDSAARALYTEGEALDTALTRATATPSTGCGDTGRILSGITGPHESSASPFERWRAAAAGLALGASVAGFAAGYFGGATSTPVDDTTYLAIDDAVLSGGEVDIWSLL